MYVLINTMPAFDCFLGRVLSVHRTIEAAQIADDKLQRTTRAGSGNSSYIPTMCVKVGRKVSRGDMIEHADVSG